MPHLHGHTPKTDSSASSIKSANSTESGVPAGVPPAQQASWGSFIKSLANISGDLSSMTAPPFILSPTSLTEFPAYWGERPELFAAISDAQTEELRAKAVLRWFICTLKGQYTSRNEKMGSEKKPLNPVLGELFFGHWPDVSGRGDTVLAVEQVSHHPPITAYYMENKKKGVSLEGASGQKTSFSFPSIVVKQNGHAMVRVALPDGKVEKFLITLPRLRIDGLVTGSPYMEVTDTSYIQSSTGFLSTIVYSGKGYISGKAHSFKATMTDARGSSIFTAEGQWDKFSKVGKTSEVFSDATPAKEEVTVAAIALQGEWESRRLWKEVADGIRTGNFDKAQTYKTAIEVKQREMRKAEQEAGTPWQLRYFKYIADDPEYEDLAARFKYSPAKEESWIFGGKFPGEGGGAEVAKVAEGAVATLAN